MTADVDDPCPRCGAESIEPRYAICRSCAEKGIQLTPFDDAFIAPGTPIAHRPDNPVAPLHASGVLHVCTPAGMRVATPTEIGGYVSLWQRVVTAPRAAKATPGRLAALEDFAEHVRMWSASDGDLAAYILDGFRRLDSSGPRSETAMRPGGIDTTWPARDVVDKLGKATSILLIDMNYDGHGWEEIDAALKVAQAWLREHPTTEKEPIDG